GHHDGANREDHAAHGAEAIGIAVQMLDPFGAGAVGSVQAGDPAVQRAGGSADGDIKARHHATAFVMAFWERRTIISRRGLMNSSSMPAALPASMAAPTASVNRARAASSGGGRAWMIAQAPAMASPAVAPEPVPVISYFS